MKKKFIVLIILLVFVLAGLSIAIIYTRFEEKPLEISGEGLDASLLKTYKITFDKNNAKSIGSDSSECLAVAGVCTIITPTIVAEEGYTAIGWSAIKNSTTKQYNELETIIVSSDMKLYAVVKKREATNNKYEVGEICNNTNDICKNGINNVEIACTQVGYKEKASNSNLDRCINNFGSGNYNKYGNNGGSWDASFVNWVLLKANINLSDKGLKDSIYTDSYIAWAKANNRWYTSKSSIKEGDLVITSNNHIGILFKDNNNWKIISGNMNDSVSITDITNVTGYISLKSLAY